MRTYCRNTLAGMALGLLSTSLLAAHPHPQPMPGPSIQTELPDGTIHVQTPTGLFPPGADSELPFVDSNLFDSLGAEMPYTLPSRPGVAFNLHDGPVVEEAIPVNSPSTDLRATLEQIYDLAKQGAVDIEAIQDGIDILEGNPIPGVTYSGFALLHYTGPERIRKVEPVVDAAGKVVGGELAIHQVWYDNHIESDTALIDPTEVQDVPWTITYTIDVLKGGADDFSPFVMYYDAPPSPTSFVTSGEHGPPHAAMDATFYPMKQGKRYTIRVRQAPAKYFNLIYTWGWRVHPPRVQAAENALKVAGPMRLTDWEIQTFGPAPRSSEQSKLAAIAKIGNLSPAKRMWQALRDSGQASPEQVEKLMVDALLAFEDWSDRRSLPRGVAADPDADVTLFYVNNTLYGNTEKFDGNVFTASVRNGDNFPHGYVAVDFGGLRGWENQFQESGGPGGSHTFGRAYYWPIAGGPNGPIVIMPAGMPGDQRTVRIELNYDLPERLHIYQFDPFHHDVAIYSIH